MKNLPTQSMSLQIIDDNFIKQGEFCLRADLKAERNVVEVEGSGAFLDSDDNSYYTKVPTLSLQFYYNDTANLLQRHYTHFKPTAM